jgi:hypothetical protein
VGARSLPRGHRPGAADRHAPVVSAHTAALHADLRARGDPRGRRSLHVRRGAPGAWARDAFGLARNHYDRVGHFAQGFIPAIVAREILIRRNVVRGRGWLYFFVVSICLAISAAYELLEWSVAIATGSKSDAFLGTQGDVWDTQKDMALALIGAITAPLLLGRLHDRQLARLGGPGNR